MTKTIFLAGISGVGKTTLLKKIGSEVVFQHLQASTLIGDELLRDDRENTAHDKLRSANIDENQQALIRGFARNRNKMQMPIVIDGHTVIDTPSGYICVPASVFDALTVEHIIFLSDAPDRVAHRRQQDSSRKRPSRTVSELHDYQRMALLHATSISAELRIPLIQITAAAYGDLISLLLGSVG